MAKRRSAREESAGHCSPIGAAGTRDDRTGTRRESPLFRQTWRGGMGLLSGSPTYGMLLRPHPGGAGRMPNHSQHSVKVPRARQEPTCFTRAKERQIASPPLLPYGLRCQLHIPPPRPLGRRFLVHLMDTSQEADYGKITRVSDSFGAGANEFRHEVRRILAWHGTAETSGARDDRNGKNHVRSCPGDEETPASGIHAVMPHMRDLLELTSLRQKEHS